MPVLQACEVFKFTLSHFLGKPEEAAGIDVIEINKNIFRLLAVDIKHKQYVKRKKIQSKEKNAQQPLNRKKRKKLEKATL